MFGIKSRSTLALVIFASLAFHLVALLVFGAIKLASVVLDREEQVFVSAPVDPPPEEMPTDNDKIQKPNAFAPPPRVPTIVLNRPTDLVVPALNIDVDIESTSGYGYGGPSLSGLENIRTKVMDDIMTDMGTPVYTEGALEATLIDLKRNRSGKAINVNRVSAIREFADGSWNLNNLTRKYYSAKNKLYMSFWMIKNGPASRAPESFGVKGDIEPSGIAALYQGTYTPSKDMEMRFCGMADDVLIVRLNSRIVLDASWQPGYSNFEFNQDGPKLPGIPKPIRNGKWTSLKAGETYDLKILVAEIPGGSFGCFLFYQLRGEDRLRIFSTKPITDAERKILREVNQAVADAL